MKREWRIGTLARAHGLNPKTIRYYEEVGVLPLPPRSAAGYRIYGQEDRERLEFVAKSKAIGFSLAEMRQILALREAGTQPCRRVAALLDQKLASVEAQLQALTAFRQELLTLRAQASTLSKAGGCICGIIEQGVNVGASPAVTGTERSRRSPPTRT